MSDVNTTWPLPAARDQLSQLVKAAAFALQTLTVHGKRAAVVLTPQSYARLKKRRARPCRPSCCGRVCWATRMRR